MSEDDQTEYIRQMARQLGLTLPADEIVRVKAMLSILERAAVQVSAASLPGDTIAAAVFCPGQVLKE